MNSVNIQLSERTTVRLYRAKKAERGRIRDEGFVKKIVIVWHQCDRSLLRDRNAPHWKWSVMADGNVRGVALDKVILDIWPEWYKTK